MKRTSSSAEIPDSTFAPQALVPVYEARRRRTVQLVEAGAKALKTERLAVSLASLAARTRQLDPDGKGVSETTIQRNPEARAIYELHRAAVGTRRVERSATASKGAAKVGGLAIKPERDLARAHRRYHALGGQLMLVRPDGYLASRAPLDRPGIAERYLQQLTSSSVKASHR